MSSALENRMYQIGDRLKDTEHAASGLRADLDALHKGVQAFAQKIEQDKANTDAALASITKQQDADRATTAEQAQAIAALQASLAELAEGLAGRARGR